jgi:hypothetical protein
LGSVLVATTAHALSLHLVVHDMPKEAVQTVTLQARSLAGTAPAIERQISVPSDSKFDLAEGLWELSIRSESLWASRRVLPSEAEVTMELWPAATLRGTLPKTAPPITQMRATFTPAAREGPGPSGDSICTVNGSEWTCIVAAGAQDLRFGVPGYAAVHRWAVRIPAGGNVAIGALTFVRGASLSGYVSVQHGIRADLTEVRVTATPRGAAGTATVYTAVPNPKGFFQIAAIAPGDYVIDARGKTTRAEGTVIRVLKDLNAELRSPLLLDKPKQISISITPALAPDGSRWQIELLRNDADANRLDPIATEHADPDGSWRHDAVAGDYVVNVGESDESQWFTEAVHVSTANVALHVDIHPIRISGSITLGDRPIAARVIFGGHRSKQRKAVVADEQGHFAGVIPPGMSNSDGWEVNVENDAPAVRRTLEHLKPWTDDEGNLRLDIHLPSASIVGRVINLDGSPEPNAIVMLEAPEGHEVQQTFTVDDG